MRSPAVCLTYLLLFLSYLLLSVTGSPVTRHGVTSQSCVTCHISAFLISPSPQLLSALHSVYISSDTLHPNTTELVAISSRCSDRRGSVMVSRLQFTRVFTARQELRRRIQKQVIDPIALERNQFILSACQNHKQATQVPEPETPPCGTFVSQARRMLL